MKRLTAGILSLVMLLVLCGCGKKDGETTWQEQYDLGVRYLSDGNYEEAIIAFTAAIEIDPRRAEAYVGRGSAYIGAGETVKNLAAAQADYEKAIELDDTNAEAYLGLADVYIRQGEYDEAANILGRGLEAVGEDAEIAAALEELTEREPEPADATAGEPESGDPIFERFNALCGVIRSEREELDGMYCIRGYDAAGNCVRTTYCEPDGTVTGESISEYDAAGNMVRSTMYTPDGELESYTEMENDAAGNQIRGTIYHADGTVEFSWAHEYDADGNLARTTVYNGDGSVQNVAEY